MSSPLSGDGYFATWACFLVSCAFIYQEVAFYRGQLDALKNHYVYGDGDRDCGDFAQFQAKFNMAICVYRHCWSALGDQDERPADS
mgnify:CR=1 FL=1